MANYYDKYTQAVGDEKKQVVIEFVDDFAKSLNVKFSDGLKNVLISQCINKPQTCLDTALSPWCKFITVFKNKCGSVDTLNNNPNGYLYLNNCVAKGYVNEINLNGNYKDIQGKNNDIIFNKSLYSVKVFEDFAFICQTWYYLNIKNNISNLKFTNSAGELESYGDKLLNLIPVAVVLDIGKFASAMSIKKFDIVNDKVRSVRDIKVILKSLDEYNVDVEDDKPKYTEDDINSKSLEKFKELKISDLSKDELKDLSKYLQLLAVKKK